ncbi:hypothetical protein [Phenylobacterium sp.]|jgi:hypothetical protein|uniref:hypothetical protein n=1 Tax=Phenylobacterium sp. TaxID=1871053 RepID=UPI002E2FE726|nr:hypothetical protein [Phenylobacterium sp.]HEX2559225.1 hypothetical protein [Phenylobacterium sp.]
MIKTITATALLLAAAALPAQAQEIRINVAGKSADAVQAELRAAAHAVCKRDKADGPSPLELQLNANCVQKAYSTALANWQNIQVAKAQPDQLAAR